MDIKLIEENVDNVLKETNIDFLGEKKIGKVRDIYVVGDKVFLVSTDRHSSFDRNIAFIPLKGQILTQTSFFNFTQTEDIIKNHVLGMPDPNVIMAKKCEVAPVEVILRGFLTGSTQTSIWPRYEAGERDFKDFTLPDGMKKNQKFDIPLITPTTKFEEHDRNLTSQEILDEKYLTPDQWNHIQDISIRLFKRGQEIANERGLILVDTKYEFGFDENNELTLIDEIHTQDSSRYWFADSYQEKFNNNEEPEYFDKEFLRLWFKDNCDPYGDEVLPEAPSEMRAELSRRYIEIYEKLTGEEFQADLSGNIEERIKKNLEKYKNL